MPRSQPHADLYSLYEAGAVARRALQRIAFVHDATSAATLHHAALFAVAANFPDGPVDCESMPADAVELDVWTSGGAPLQLQRGIGLALPEGTRRLVVQAHVLRTHDGPARPAGPKAPHLAAILALSRIDSGTRTW